MVSCRNDNYVEGSVDFSFSEDTLRFDTVFTELGSATRWVKIFNPLSDAVLIESMQMANENSFFRMNINGNSSKVITDVEIPGGDSIYVFIEVTIDPDNPLSVSPFIIEDDLIINREGDNQLVHLEAFGQNANYIPDRFSAGSISFDLCQSGNILWNDPKPYVVYGILVIEGCTLELAPGTRVYVHGGIVNDPDSGPYSDGNITIGPNGSIKSMGTLQDTVVFQGDRLEAPFADISGQWSGLRLFNESKNNTFSYTTIKNSILGLRVDSLAEVSIDHCKIYNTSSVGLLGVHATIAASNTLIHSNAGVGLQCIYGGNYDFDYCTVASYGNDMEAVNFRNYLCRGFNCEFVDVNPLNLTVDNCIFTGSQSEELVLDDISSLGIETPFNYRFRNTLVRVDSLLESELFSDFLIQCENCINYNTSTNDTLFVSIDDNLFQLDTSSVAEERGLNLSAEGFTDDLLGNPRDPILPDMGCYEFQK